MQQNLFGNNIPNFNWMMYNMMMGNQMNMGNNMMPNINNNQNDNLGMVYGSGQNMNQGNQTSYGGVTKNNINFKTTAGLQTFVTVDCNKTLSDTILLYLKRVNRENLFKENSGILFLYNAKIINIFDKTTIGDFFGQMPNPIIMVNDVKNLIGAFSKN